MVVYLLSSVQFPAGACSQSWYFIKVGCPLVPPKYLLLLALETTIIIYGTTETHPYK